MKEEQLLKRIETLEAEVSSLKKSFSIPLPVEQAFVGRGFLKTNPPQFITATDYTSMGRNIELSGDAQSINVLQYPWQWGQITGKNLFVPLYVIAEFGE